MSESPRWKFFIDGRHITNMLIRSLGRYGCLGLFHLCLLHLLTFKEANGMNHSVAFFNASSLGSQINISSILDFRSQFLFSFRTCSSGRLIHQTGPFNNNNNNNNSSEFFVMHLTQNGSLMINWRSVSVATTDSVEIKDLNLMNNEWFTIDCSFALGQVLLQVEQGAVVRRSVVLANSTYRSYLWSLNLTGGSPLEVGGEGFSGCIQQGSQVLLSSPSTVSTGVAWDVCPLEDSVGCGSAVVNPCWMYPCLNDGTCVYLGSGTNFTCQCHRMNTGSRCEVDLSSLGCDLNPCLNNGSCQSTNVTSQPYLCICAPGFAGRDCGTNKDECASNPCRNGGRCIDGINRFSCLCNNTGYAGTLCQMDIDECQLGLVTCQNGGSCMNTPGSYKCICTLGFTGNSCQNQSDNCQSNPCQNSGTCSRLLGAYNCSCSPGFTGSNCQINIDDCVGVICPGNHTQCVDGINSFTCQCLPGFYDTTHGSNTNGTLCEDINECVSNPCANGSTCVNGLNVYTCQCQAGFTGRQCQTAINECQSNPCQNGGTCDDLIDGFRCRCPSGFTDNNCSTDINECQSTPCHNDATCIDMVGHFLCNCSSGWSGDFCQQDVNECNSSPCLNGATCNNLVNRYNCSCPLGYTGMNCGINIDDCLGSVCLNNATCIDGINNYTCQCTDAWMGYNCSLVYDPCVMSVCQNNGTCQSHPPSHNYTCQCAAGFTGHDCQQNIDDCQNNSCLSYQACFDGINSYSCACPVGMTGSMCETDINECQSNPCLNGATCIDGKGNFSCHCSQEVVNLTAYSLDPKSVFRLGYTGIRCDRLIDACSYRQPSICINNGTCDHSNDPGSLGFTCSCRSLVGTYYTGRFCQQTRDPCQLAIPVACFYGGTCQSVGDQYICHCAPGYTGGQCQTEINECDSNPCHYNGSCQDAVNRYSCQCVPGTTGVNCETNIDECASGPCQNDGQCVDLINGRSGASLNVSIDRYKCNCSETGFQGITCETDIDECLSNPCQHNATCENDRNMYICRCYPGYTGVNCETDIDECLSSPCQFNGTCLQRSNSSRPEFSFETAAGYDCICPAGITGPQCETNINECASQPCIHGNCDDLINGYVCRCYPGYRGISCEEEIDECKEYQPCTNGATCLDRIADYKCVCAAQNGGKVFGGKKCNVELIGCQNNLCANGSTCRPFLSNETIQDYACLCLSGFGGTFCNVSTSVSLDSDSFLSSLVKDNVSDVLSISLDFRSTLSDFTLLTLLTNQSIVDFRLDLVGASPSRLQLTSSHLLNGFIMIDGKKTLNDGEWHGFQLNLTSSNISFRLSDCIANCSSVASLLGGQWSYNDGGVVVNFGGNNSNLGTFVGCMRDIQVNRDRFLPGVERNVVSQTSFVSRSVGLGCERRPQCNPDPCNGHGSCLDLWTKYRCHCQRPFWATNCTKRFLAATFGNDGIPSLAQFNLTTEQRSELEDFFDVSFFFRTRKSVGLLFYIGTGTMDSSQPNVSYVALQLNDGRIVSRLKLSDNDELSFKGSSGDLADGQQHFVQLIRNASLLRLVVNSNSLDFALNSTHPLMSSVVFIGGVPSGQQRRRRAVAPGNAFLEGTMEDIRLNNFQLQIFVVNETDSSVLPTVTPSGLTNVLPGEVTSDVCRIQQPCVNNATCDNIFFNDFYCNCTNGFRGRNCSQLNFCVYHTCPPGGRCQNLDDGFECVSNATLNGNSSFLRYSTTVNQLELRGITANVRTRKESGKILQLFPGSSFSICSIVLELSDGEVLLRFNTTSGDEQMEHQLRAMTPNGSIVADGTVHAIDIRFERSGEVRLSVDDVVVVAMNYSTISSRCNSSSGFTTAIVGSPRQNSVGSVGDFFKGCLSEVRINDILLPFFNKSQLLNNSAVERFDLEETKDVLIGCYGDDVCGERTNPCRNGATCEDLWNAFSCHCTPGYTSLTCSENIDDCLNNKCLNGATCLDSIANYTCACSQGYTGFRCEMDVDECLSNPCLHNGSCSDRVNGYSCSCPQDYVGQRCQMPADKDCHQFQCLNNATCITLPIGEDGLAMWQCSCVNGYTGSHCETRMDLCANNTCHLSSSTCQPIYEMLTYTCQCHPGYTGKTCANDIDECTALEPCFNGGNCSNSPGSYSCLCTSEWTGQKCDEPTKHIGFLPDREFLIPLVVGVCVGSSLLILLIAIIVFLCIARRKRATHGTYSPSRQEMAGSRVDMRSALKLPPEERLI